jgi:hypothetical protein
MPAEVWVSCIIMVLLLQWLWAIVDQSRGKASTRFLDDEGNDEYE